jgi:integrase
MAVVYSARSVMLDLSIFAGPVYSTAVPADANVTQESTCPGDKDRTPVFQSLNGILHSLANDTKVSDATPEKRRRGKSMSRRSGQSGHLELSGKWYVVRFWQDVVGQEKRKHVREKICPISGPALLTESQRRRKAKEIIAASGADTVEYLEKIQAANLGVTFHQQSERWLEHMRNRKRKPIASSTYDTWKSCLDRWLLPKLGDLPLSSVDNDPVRGLVCELVNGNKLGPKSISEYIKVVKSVVASAKDPKTRKQIYAVVWDDEYLDLPVVEKKDQNRPAFDGKTVAAIVLGVKRWAQMLFILLASTGLRIGEVLGLEIDKHIADDCTTLLIRQKVRHCKVEAYLKTSNAYRDVDVHPAVSKMIREFIGNRTSGFLFQTRNGRPLSDSDILSRHLHPMLRKLEQGQAGHHAFRRFRVTWLRKQRCPADLRHFWLGHAGKSVEDDYDRMREEIGFRKQVVEKIGLGFKLPSPIVPNVPSSEVVPEEEIAVSF